MNNITNICINRILCNWNSCTVYKVAFYTHTIGLHLTCRIKQTSKSMCTDGKLFMNNMNELIDVRTGQRTIDNYSI